MPLDADQVGERRFLGDRFLHVVLAERALAERVHFANRLRREGLGNREQAHRTGRPCGGRECLRDALARDLPLFVVPAHNRLAHYTIAAWHVYCILQRV